MVSAGGQETHWKHTRALRRARAHGHAHAHTHTPLVFLTISSSHASAPRAERKLHQIVIMEIRIQLSAGAKRKVMPLMKCRAVFRRSRHQLFTQTLLPTLMPQCARSSSQRLAGPPRIIAVLCYPVRAVFYSPQRFIFSLCVLTKLNG